MTATKLAEWEAEFAKAHRTFQDEHSVSLHCVGKEEVFELCFGDSSGAFFSQLMTASGFTNPKVSTAFWQPTTQGKEGREGKVRKILVVAGSRRDMPFFSRKSVTMHLKQASFQTRHGIVVFGRSIMEGATFMTMERWEISGKDGVVSIRLRTAISSHNPQNPSFLTLVRSKSMRYYQNFFKQWKRLMNGKIFEHFEKSRQSPENQEVERAWELFEGRWCKLTSHWQITIQKRQIKYQDGSTFKAQIVKAPTNKHRYLLRALYADGPFEGTLSDDKRILRWNNNSTWIRNGYDQFSGKYLGADGKNRVIWSFGTIDHCLSDGSPIRTKCTLQAPDMLAYTMRRKQLCGRFTNAGRDTLRWSDGTVWTKCASKDSPPKKREVPEAKKEQANTVAEKVTVSSPPVAAPPEPASAPTSATTSGSGCEPGSGAACKVARPTAVTPTVAKAASESCEARTPSANTEEPSVNDDKDTHKGKDKAKLPATPLLAPEAKDTPSTFTTPSRSGHRETARQMSPSFSAWDHCDEREKSRSQYGNAGCETPRLETQRKLALHPDDKEVHVDYFHVEETREWSHSASMSDWTLVPGAAIRNA